MARGLIRYVVVVVDASAASKSADVRPTRLGGVCDALSNGWFADFFATNPRSTASDGAFVSIRVSFLKNPISRVSSF